MKSVSVRQFAFLTFIIIAAQKLLVLPVFLLRTGGRDSYISVAVMLLVEVVVLVIIMLAIKKTDKNFFQVLERAAGSILGRVIAAVMLVVMVIKILLFISVLRVFFVGALGQNLRDWLAIGLLCALMFYIATKSLRGLGRLGEIFLPLCVVAILALGFFASGNIRPRLIMPFLENGMRPVMDNLWFFPLWFGDLAVMVIFLGQVKLHKRNADAQYTKHNAQLQNADIKSTGKNHFIKAGVIAAVLGSVAVLYFCTVLFMTYADVAPLLNYSANVSGLLLYSSQSYRYGRFDIPIFCLFILSLFVVLALFFYAATRHVSYITKAKNNTIVSGVCAVAVYLLFLIFCRTEHALFSFSLTRIRFFAVFNSIIIPVFILIAACVLGRSKRSNPLSNPRGLRLNIDGAYFYKSGIRKLKEEKA